MSSYIGIPKIHTTLQQLVKIGRMNLVLSIVMRKFILHISNHVPSHLVGRQDQNVRIVVLVIVVGVVTARIAVLTVVSCIVICFFI